MRPSLRSPSGLRLRPSLSLILLFILFAALWIAGGASRADAPGQLVVRSVAWVLLLVAAVFGERPRLWAERPVLLLLAGTLLLALVQLVPLPPAIWQLLPGRSAFLEAAAASGQPQPWRPWSIVPGATLNAVSSLVVPAATLTFYAGLRDDERHHSLGLLLGLIAAAMFVGLLQFSAGGLDNPFVNDTPGELNGTFANRNHFALFLAFGCVLAPAWAFVDGRRPGWRAPLALGLALLFALMLLAVGSRAGLLLGLLALAAGLFIARRGIGRELAHRPRWVLPALIAGVVGLVAVIVLVSVVTDRAVAIDRVIGADPGRDMRVRGLPTVLDMIREYFPWGSGLGGFDPLFRLHEPLALLKLTYFNHAHNDWLEIALDAGLPGLLLLGSALLWWGWASVRAWRAPEVRPRAGSTMLLLVFIASLFDYPARTPLMMAVIVVAAAWLAGAGGKRPSPALPLE